MVDLRAIPTRWTMYGRKFLIFGFCLSIFALTCFNVYAVTGTDVLRIGAGVWSGTTRIIPTLAKVAGGAAGGAWYRVPFSPAGIGIMLACLTGQYLWNHYDDDSQLGEAIRAVAAQVGYRKGSSGQPQYGSINYAPIAGSAYANSVASIKSTAPRTTWGTLVYESHSTTSALRASSYSAYWTAHPEYSTWASFTADNGNASCIGKYNYYNQGQGYAIMCYPTSNVAGSIAQQTTWVDKTVAQAQTDFQTAVTDATQTDAERSLWDAVEGQIATDLDATTTSGILQATNSAGKTLDTALNEQAEAGINSESTPAEGSTGVIDAIKSLYELIKNGISSVIASISSALGLSDTVADVSTQGIDANENTTVVDGAGGEVDLTAKKAELSGILDTLWNAVGSLRGRVEEKINSMIGSSGSVCSVTFEYYGTHAISFCDIDMTIIRSAVIVVATIAAVMIIIM